MKKRYALLALPLLLLGACANAPEPNTVAADLDPDAQVSIDADDDGYTDAFAYVVERAVILDDGRTVSCVVSLTYSSGGGTAISCDWEGAK